MGEQDLIELAVGGDLDAFNRLVLQYQDAAYNAAFRILSDPAAAEDATQEAVISMYRKLNTYRGGSFKSWFLRIVTNACYDELRRRQRRPSVPLEPENDEGELVDSPSWMEDDAPGPEEAASAKELEDAIQHCLADLEEKFRVVMVLVDIAGEDYESVCAIINRPMGTVKSRLARARQKMQDCLRGFGELLPEKFRLKDEVME
ncbi:MAG: sigma-70 family RNA polymerase sigma factor [Chloroflexi bacterium]|jgi:RNA polymerase sigma-70 factor (ECF subfamily)|nr:sigma-70 family RNA polymerase sigma factor [Chloroflexota bacterium]HOE35140.1 sigma-70 family RNA polymerase sigma factor [Anaerolineaceae bacterium]HQL28063.1 sigma-70 family RNA polymerase sigma factor [Anaerolineaceae bacterium]